MMRFIEKVEIWYSALKQRNYDHLGFEIKKKKDILQDGINDKWMIGLIKILIKLSKL